MTNEQARQVAELLGNAKKALMEALSIVEHSADAKLACQIGTLCGRTEVLQRRASEKAARQPKISLRRFARENRL